MNKLPLQKMHSCYRNYCIIVTESAALLLPKVLHCCYRKHCTSIYRNYCILSYRYHLHSWKYTFPADPYARCGQLRAHCKWRG